MTRTILTITISMLVAFAAQADILLALPGSGGGNNNPDGWAESTQTLYSNDYNTEVSGDLWDGGSNNVVNAVWGSNYGYNNSGAWRVSPDAPSNNENEANVDLSGSSWNADDTDTMVVSWMQYFTQDLLDNTADGSTPEWKAIDVRMYNSGGTAPDDNTRQAPLFVKKNYADTSPPADHPTQTGTGIWWSLIRGGGEANFVNDGVTPQVDFTNEGDQWIWFSIVFDLSGTWVYMKRVGDSSVTRVIRRLSTDEDAASNTYTYNARGWYQNKYIFGYWDDVLGIQEPTQYLVVDRVRVTNGWVDPPF